MPAAERFEHREGGGQVRIALATFPAMILTAVVSQQVLDRPAGPGPVVVAVLAALFAHFAFGAERVVEIDDRGLRYCERRLRFGVRGAVTVQWEVPMAQLVRVREVTTRVPSSRGGWNTGTRLHVTEQHALDASDLGGKGIPDSAYTRLTKALQNRLGEAFVEEQVT